MIPNRLKVLFQESPEKSAPRVPPMIGDSQLLVKKDERGFEISDPRHSTHDWFRRLMLTCREWIMRTWDHDCSWWAETPDGNGYDFDKDSSLPGKLQWAVRALYEMNTIKLPDIVGGKFLYATNTDTTDATRDWMSNNWMIEDFTLYYNIIWYVYNNGVPGDTERIKSQRKISNEIVKLYNIEMPDYVEPYDITRLELLVRASYINDNLTMKVG